MFVAVWVGCSLVLRWVIRGTPRDLADVSVPHAPVVWLVFVLQALARSRFAAAYLAPQSQVIVWSVVSVVLAAMILRLWRFPGAQLLVAGLCCNVLVVLLNGGMPVVVPSTLTDYYGFYHPASSADQMVWMGDVLPLGRQVLSIGDLLLFVGVTHAILAGGRATAEHAAIGSA